MRMGLLTALLVGVSLIHGGALADTGQRAKALFQEGNRLRAKRDHAGALARYREAYQLAPSYKIDLNMGLSYLDMGRRAEAATMLERFLRRGAHRSPGYIVTLAHRRLARLKRSLASIRVQCGMGDATVTVNGLVRGRTPLHEAIYFAVDGVPMSLDITVRRRGYLPRTFKRVLRTGRHVELDVVLRPGPRVPGVRVQMDLDRSLGPKVPHAREQLELDDSLGPWPSRAVMETEMDDEGDPIQAAQRRRKTIWGLTLLGTGLALAVTAGVLYGVGVSAGDEAYERYQASTAGTDQATIDGHREEVEAARAKVAAGSVLLGAALAATGVSIYLLVTRPVAADRRRSAGVGALGVVPVQGGAAVSLGGRF